MTFNNNIGISDTATIESLKEYEKTILELQQTYKQTLDSMLEAAKNYQNKAKDNNPYAQALAIVQKEQEELNANVGYYKMHKKKGSMSTGGIFRNITRLWQIKRGCQPTNKPRLLPT